MTYLLSQENYSVTNYAGLRTKIPTGLSASIVVDGYYTSGDGGGGIFNWDSSSSSGDNGGTIIVPTGSITGRWKRVFDGTNFNVLWFGLVGDNTTPNDAAFYNLNTYLTANTIEAKINFPQGNFVFNGYTYNISAATNASPIEITTTAATIFKTGDYVTITGVSGNTTANGQFQITVIDSSHFTLNGSTGNGAYISSGTVSLAWTIPAFPEGTVFSGQNTALVFNSPGYGFNTNAYQHFDNIEFIANYTNGSHSVAISNVSTTTPIEVTTVSAHGYSNGDLINIYGVGGNINGSVNSDPSTPHNITVIDSTHFTLNGTTATTGAYSNSSFNISAATNASPIEITTTAAYSFFQGDLVYIAGVGGNTAANGQWRVNVIDSTHFQLSGSVGNGNYTSGGTVTYGGVACSNSHINLVGLNILVNSGDIQVTSCNFNGFKYGISIDGGELCYINKCSFAMDVGGFSSEGTLDNSNHSAFAIRLGSFIAGEEYNGFTNVNTIDQCEFDGCLYSIMHHDGVSHFVSRSNFEFAVIAVIMAFCYNISYEKCTNDGSTYDIFQFQSDWAGGSASYGFSIRDCFFSGNKSVVNLNPGRGFPVALYGIVYEGVSWAGSTTALKGSEYFLGGYLVQGNGINENASISDGWITGKINNLAYSGTPINQIDGGQGYLDMFYEPGGNAFIIRNGQWQFYKNKWVATHYGVDGGRAQRFYDVYSYNTDNTGTRSGIGIGWIQMPALSSDIYNITSASNTTPITVGTQSSNTIWSGSNYIVNISGVTGNTAANGQWVTTGVDGYHFSLNGSVGNNAYISGGTINSFLVAATDMPASLITAGTITMRVTAINLNNNSEVSVWTIKQRYYWYSTFNLITPADEIESNDVIGLTTPQITFINSSSQVACILVPHATFLINYAVKFDIDLVGQ